jgi:hypothetical protein
VLTPRPVLLELVGTDEGSPDEHLSVDVGPVLRGFGDFLRRNGIPVEEYKREKAVRLSASFRMRDRLPAMSFHLGDRSTEPFGAFYGNDGFRASLVWPVGRFSLRVEGGEDSEFGSYGIAGAQWAHPSRPFAVGLGFPLRLRNADGEFGVIVQLRAKIF